MKKFIPMIFILITLFASSCTTESTKEYDVGQNSIVESTDTEDETVSVYVTDTGRKYHKYGCRYLNYSCFKKELQEAINQGYTPCSICIKQ